MNALPPLLDNKNLLSPSIFQARALLREARRQKNLNEVPVPGICILDPDGDIVRRLRSAGQTKSFENWPCYHTRLDTFVLGGRTVGIVGSVVGASFAVLVAEELFASGCQFLVSVTSAGQIAPVGSTPYFVIIDRALRDEGTSYHYLPLSEYSEADPPLVTFAVEALQAMGLKAFVSSAQAGQRTRLSARPRMRSRPRAHAAYSLSRWKPPLSMRSADPLTDKFFVSLTSRIRWRRPHKTLRRVKQTAQLMPCAFLKRSFQSYRDDRGTFSPLGGTTGVSPGLTIGGRF